MKEKHSIVLIDDEEDILDFLSYNLRKEGYVTFVAKNGEEGLKLVKEINPHLVIIDVMMPGMDGIEVCQLIRNEISINQPIITFLTSRGEDYSQIAGLEAGADDYITKPIRPRLLLSKIESLLRRLMSEKGQKNTKEIIVDRDTFTVQFKGAKLVLPKKEFELLELLTSRPGKVFSRDQILINIWGNEAIVGERTIDVHIRKLREKLGNHYIRTIKGVGYTFISN
jgi:two-component system alkaline phosphatase synthesis response regulator PhoP